MKASNYFISILALVLCTVITPSFANINDKAWAKPIDETFNFYQVSPFLYRSALPEARNVDLIKQKNIGTIISFIKDDDRNWLGSSSDIQLLRYPSHADRIKDDDVLDVLKMIQSSKSKGRPVLIHCKHGQNRTGLFVAMYRIVVESWTKQQAINELVYNSASTQPEDVEEALAYIHKAKVKKIRKALQTNSCSTSKYAICQWFS